MEEQSDSGIDYSIVIPVYYNEGCLHATFDALKSDVVLNNPHRTCEIIFIDDGSGDASLAELLEIQNTNPRLVKIIKLTRNFGQPRARLAGLHNARGNCVVTMSADGQDPASLINEMLKAHFEEKFEIVACTRSGRDESKFRILTSKIFYRLMRKLSFPNMPLGGYDFVLLGRKALEVVLNNQEANPFFQGQILWTGFRPKFIEYERRKRDVGRSRWTFGRKITLLIDGVLNYSFLPIRLVSLTGIVIAILGGLFSIFIFFRRLFLDTVVDGWAALMIVVLILGGIQMLMLGIIGEYVWRTQAQVLGRDPYVIEKIYENS